MSNVTIYIHDEDRISVQQIGDAPSADRSLVIEAGSVTIHLPGDEAEGAIRARELARAVVRVADGIDGGDPVRACDRPLTYAVVERTTHADGSVSDRCLAFSVTGTEALRLTRCLNTLRAQAVPPPAPGEAWVAFHAIASSDWPTVRDDGAASSLAFDPPPTNLPGTPEAVSITQPFPFRPIGPVAE